MLAEDPCRLYQAVLNSPGDETLLGQLRARAKEVLTYLRTAEAEEIRAARPGPGVPSHWLATVYEAIGEAEPFPMHLGGTREALLQAHAEDERAIGGAFQGSLLADLPDNLTSLAVLFKTVPRIPEREQLNLRQTPSVVAGGSKAVELVPYGLTPLGVYYATKALFPLVKRLQERGKLDQSETVVLSGADDPHARFDNPVVPIKAVMLEFVQVARCGQAATRALLRWLIDVAQFRPWVFEGARARPSGLAVSLCADSAAPLDLDERWSKSDADVEEPVGTTT